LSAERLPVLLATGISKTYRDRSLIELLSSRERSRGSGSVPGHALEPFDLSLDRGSSIGIIGRNGAGKSSLLRILAGVARPSTGRVEVAGTRRSLLDLGAGMIEELSGRRNALLQLGLDGLDAPACARAWQRIHEFSGLGRFADAPLRTYSAGMRVRLAYAVAIATPCDLLIADEVLAVGDEEFQRRCSQHVRDFLREGGSLVLASHNLYHVEKLCREAIWLEEGRVRARGPAREVTAAYRSWIEAGDVAPESDHVESERGLSVGPPPDDAGPPRGGGLVDRQVVTLRTFCGGEATTRLREGGDLDLRLSPGPAGGGLLEVVRPSGQCVLALPVAGDGLHIEALPLLPGRYRIRLTREDGTPVKLDGDTSIDCVGSSRELGSIRLRHAWRGGAPA